MNGVTLISCVSRDVVVVLQAPGHGLLLLRRAQLGPHAAIEVARQEAQHGDGGVADQRLVAADGAREVIVDDRPPE